MVAQPGLSSAWPEERKEFLKGKQSNLSLDFVVRRRENELDDDNRTRDGPCVSKNLSPESPLLRSVLKSIYFAVCKYQSKSEVRNIIDLKERRKTTPGATG